MSTLGWKCQNCNAWNANGFDTCPECKNGTVKTPVQMSDIEPIRMKKRGRSKWLYLGLYFDSKDEAQRYGYLRQLQETGIIRHLRVQPTILIREKFVLTNPFYIPTKSGKPRTISDETYTPDYAYLYNGLLVIEDVKGLKREKDKLGNITREYPYSKNNSDRSQKYLLYRYRNRHHVVFVLSCLDKDTWRYFQASTGYPELNFELIAIGKDLAA